MVNPHESSAAHNSDDYVHGEMDVRHHEDTLALFIGLTKWVGLFLGVLVLFLVILNATKLGFLTAVIASVVSGIVGWLLLKKKA